MTKDKEDIISDIFTEALEEWHGDNFGEKINPILGDIIENKVRKAYEQGSEDKGNSIMEVCEEKQSNGQIPISYLRLIINPVK